MHAGECMRCPRGSSMAYCYIELCVCCCGLQKLFASATFKTCGFNLIHCKLSVFMRSVGGGGGGGRGRSPHDVPRSPTLTHIQKKNEGYECISHLCCNLLLVRYSCPPARTPSSRGQRPPLTILVPAAAGPVRS